MFLPQCQRPSFASILVPSYGTKVSCCMREVFLFVSNFRYFLGTADISTYLTPVIIRLQLVSCLNSGPSSPVTRSEQVRVPCGTFHPWNCEFEPPHIVCVHFVSLLRHNMNQTLRFIQKPTAWKLESGSCIIFYFMQSRGRLKLVRVCTAASGSKFMWVLTACYWGSVRIILKGALQKYRVAQKSVNWKHSVGSHFMPIQIYPSQFVKLYHGVLSCLLNPQDLISGKNVNLASNKEIYKVL